jgi:hypothetical protein
MNRNLVGNTYGRFCIKFPQNRMKSEWHRLIPLSLWLNLGQVFVIKAFSLITIQSKLTIIDPHIEGYMCIFLHMSAKINFSVMVHWFSLFSEKYFTQIICMRQAKHRSVCTCVKIIILFNVFHKIFLVVKMECKATKFSDFIDSLN